MILDCCGTNKRFKSATLRSAEYWALLRLHTGEHTKQTQRRAQQKGGTNQCGRDRQRCWKTDRHSYVLECLLPKGTCP